MEVDDLFTFQKAESQGALASGGMPYTSRYNLYICNRKTAIKNRSSVKDFEPSRIDYDARIFVFREKDEEVSVTLLRSRQGIKLILGEVQKKVRLGPDLIK